MVKENLIIQLKTLTPIWTGNALGGCKEIKESNIIGSIRWWYEIVSRSLGKRVCNPTQHSKDGKCKLKRNEFIDSILQGKTIDAALDEQICPVCKLFGCNGWSSKFRLIVKDKNGKDVANDIYVKGRKLEKVQRRIKGKMFDEKSPLILEFYPLKKVSDEEWKLLKFVLKLISERAALGGRTAQGNGVVEIINQDDFEISKLRGLTSSNNKLPTLKDFFFTKCRLEFNKNISNMENNFWIENFENENIQYPNKNNEYNGIKYLWDNYKFIPIGFHIRDTVRRIKKDESERHRLFGGSKIFVSHGYKINDNTVEFRIWGYGVGKDKKEFVDKIEEKLYKNLIKEDCKKNYIIDFTVNDSKSIDNQLEV